MTGASGWLLDTNVLSEVVKKRPSPEVVGRLRALPREALYTSSICVMEMRFGAARHPDGPRLWERIEREVLGRVTVLPLGDAEARVAGDLLAQMEARGTQVGVEDVLIAATALASGLAVSTRNDRHFARFDGLTIENWWK